MFSSQLFDDVAELLAMSQSPSSHDYPWIVSLTIWPTPVCCTLGTFFHFFMSTCLTISFSSLRTLSNRLSDGGCCIALGGWPKVRVGSWESALEFRAIELIIFSIPYNSNGKAAHRCRPSCRCECWPSCRSFCRLWKPHHAGEVLLNFFNKY